jgi:hypothetical protein
MSNGILWQETQPHTGIGMNCFTSNTMLHHYFVPRCSSEHLVTVSVHEPASKDDMISNPTPVGEGFVEHEKHHPIESDSAPNRYWNEWFYI